jgi:alpha-glucosidase
MDYYFIYGPDINRYGHWLYRAYWKTITPPLWALGFHQCKWSYYLSNVRDYFKVRELQIPCDAIYLDDYMDGFRCFTWDNEKFPESY